MRKFYSLLLLLLISLGHLDAQNIQAAINVTLQKDEAPIIYPYNGGSQLIFYRDDALRFFRLNYNFQTESEGDISLEDIGTKPSLVELNANRKNIHLFFTRKDSSGLRCLSINTVNKKARQSNCIAQWSQNTVVLAHTSKDDTAYFFSSNQENIVQFYQVANGLLIKELSIEILPEFYSTWVKLVKEYPQLRKTHIIPEDPAQLHKIPFSPIKLFSQTQYLHLTIEGSFTTHVIRIKKALNQMESFSSVVSFPDNGSLRGSLSNSFISGKHLFQAVSTQRGIVVQKTHLKSTEASFSKSYTYHQCVQKGSPIFLMNRGKQGTFANKEDHTFEYHPDKSNRFLSLSVTTRGNYNHLLVSEVEPLYGFENWASTNTMVSSKNQTQKTSGSVHTFGLAPQTATHFAFLNHTNFKASTICMSLDEKGTIESYGGPQDFPLAEANVLFYKMKYSSLFPSQSTTCYFNNTLYYCFYRKSKKQYYFASLK